MVPPALDQIVRRCLEKRPEQRFQSASDLGFAIEALSGISTTAKVSPVRSGAVAVTPAPAARRLPLWLVGVVLLLVAAAAGFFAGKPFWTPPLPSYHRLTFRRGMIVNARFAPDGHTVVYSASWSGNPTETFTMRSEDPESPPLDLAKADLLSVSSTGEVAILLSAQRVAWFVSRGTLARMPLGGGTPREVLEDVQQADFAPDGTKLAVVRYVGGRNRLEYPIGHVLYETTGWISHPRVSPKGDQIAFMDHQLQWDNRGWVAVVDMTGKKTTLTGEWSGQEGVAWTPDGKEIWFTASRAGEATAVYAVTLSGRERVVARAPGFLVVHDISRDGRVLLSRGHISTGMIALPPDDARERDLSWLDFGSVRDLSADGKTFLFDQTGEGSGANYATYLRRTDGSPAVRLGDGSAAGLSPDWKWALTILHTPPQLILLPTGAGEAKNLERHSIEQYGGEASWFPDGKQVVFTGREPGRAMRCYVQDIDGGQPRAITPEGVTGTAVSPDGKFIVAGAEGQKKALYPVEGGGPQNISGLDDRDRIIRWSADGRSLFVYRYGEVPTKIYRLDLSTGRKEFFKEIVPSDPAGVVRPPSVFLTPDGKWCLYELTRFLSDLYVVGELK
jgi:Tol biopolymer transport system component